MHRSKIVKKPTNFRQNPKKFQNSYLEFSEIFHFLKFHKGTSIRDFWFDTYAIWYPFTHQISDFKTIGGTLWRNFGFRKKWISIFVHTRYLRRMVENENTDIYLVDQNDVIHTRDTFYNIYIKFLAYRPPNNRHV